MIPFQITDRHQTEIWAAERHQVFIPVSYTHLTDFLDNQIELDNKGYIVAGENTETSIPGVYAVDVYKRQVWTH